jgi:hypothetical protein
VGTLPGVGHLVLTGNSGAVIPVIGGKPILWFTGPAGLRNRARPCVGPPARDERHAGIKLSGSER